MIKKPFAKGCTYIISQLHYLKAEALQLEKLHMNFDCEWDHPLNKEKADEINRTVNDLELILVTVNKNAYSEYTKDAY